MEPTEPSPLRPFAPRPFAPRPFALRDVEDLHDADLDDVLADGLADRYDALVVATALAQLVGRSGPVAMLAHELEP